MGIHSILTEDILADVRRGDHIIFSLNTEGVHPGDNVGYSFVNRVIEDLSTEFKSETRRDFGKIVTVEVGDLFLHGIVNHSITEGWPANDEPYENNSYRAIREALNTLEERYSPNLPMKSLWLGRGKMWKRGDTKGNIALTMQAMANSENLLKVYIDGDKIDF